MGFEVDQLQREETYRTRLTRTLVLLSVLIGAALVTGMVLLKREQEKLASAEAAAAEAQLLAEAAKARAAYSADSLRAVTRLNDFMDRYKPVDIEGSSLVTIPRPRGKSHEAFLNQVWNDFAYMYNDSLTEGQKRNLYSLHYVDVMNQAWYNSKGRIVFSGENVPSGILLPGVKFRGNETDISKSTFPRIVRGQQAIGLRVEETLDQTTPADTTLAQGEAEAMETVPE